MATDARICLLGFGEVGQIVADDLTTGPERKVAAFDILFEDATSIPSVEANRREGVIATDSAVESAAGCDVIISAVTASEALNAARSVLPALDSGAFYLDLNSVSPQTSGQTGDLVKGAGGRFVEAALMSSIGARRIESPILLGGPDAEEFLTVGRTLGLTGAEFVSRELGVVSAIKMSRSVLIKGLEALLAESLATAKYYGVVDEVLRSLNDLLPDDDWSAKARYMISRSLRHGSRRADEMQEAAATVTGAGVDDWMSRAIVERQRFAAQFAQAIEDDLDGILDSLRGSREEPRKGEDYG